MTGYTDAQISGRQARMTACRDHGDAVAVGLQFPHQLRDVLAGRHNAITIQCRKPCVRSGEHDSSDLPGGGEKFAGQRLQFRLDLHDGNRVPVPVQRAGVHPRTGRPPERALPLQERQIRLAQP